MGTNFAEFAKELEAEVAAEGPQALAEWRQSEGSHFRFLVGEIISLRMEVHRLRKEIRRERLRMSAAPWVPIDEAGALLGCSRSKVFQLIRVGKLRRAESIGRDAMITRESIESLQVSLIPRTRLQRTKKFDIARELEFLDQRRKERRARQKASPRER